MSSIKDFGKTVILGDSYSTYTGYIPDGYACWYRPDNNNNVISVDSTWWYALKEKANVDFIFNSSYSGSTISGITYGQELAGEKSFVRRMHHDLLNLDFDTIFVFGGTNDSWADSPIGNLKYDDITDDDLMQVLPSFCYILKTISETHPNAKIISLINTELKSEISEGLTAACEYYGVDCIVLKNISKEGGHPDVLGMTQIRDQIVEFYK